MTEHMVHENGVWYCRAHPDRGFDANGPFACPACVRGEPAEAGALETRAASRGGTTSAAFARRPGAMLAVTDYHGQALYLDARDWVRELMAGERITRH